MIDTIPLGDILFLDIETVPQSPDFNTLSEEAQELWALKTKYQRKDEYTPEQFYERAGIWAEFGIIVCISVGYFLQTQDGRTFRVRSFTGAEDALLREFSELLDSHFSERRHLLCAHNGKEFDFPYLARRMIILGIPIPKKLLMFGKKPWEIPHLDTMELWRFGDFKNYTSLKLLAYVLGVPSPKEDIDGSMVRDVYYEEHDLERIVHYCERDVVTVAQVFLRLRNEDLLAEDQIVHV
ncbi:3'-5' exonuclease [Robiginitalea sp.]|uniref:3'-5' exonuclease n=1 Tax=Robiginitalea sp. TaxID=1902411 RepID=UPI003C77100C